MKINWLEEKVQYALTYSALKGFRVNKQAIRGIAKGLIRNNGACPCPHEEWGENTPHEDKLCHAKPSVILVIAIVICTIKNKSINLTRSVHLSNKVDHFVEANEMLYGKD